MIDWNEQALRSLLFAPGNHPRKLEKVGSFGSDAIVLDLEDAVADAEKAAARELVRAALPTYDESTVAIVRVNGERHRPPRGRRARRRLRRPRLRDGAEGRAAGDPRPLSTRSSRPASATRGSRRAVSGCWP